MNDPQFDNGTQNGVPTPPQNQDNGTTLSIIALVCGILGIIGSNIPVIQYYTTVFAILGLVFGIIGRKKSVAACGKASGMATAGLVLGVIGVAFAALGILCLAACAGCLLLSI